MVHNEINKFICPFCRARLRWAWHSRDNRCLLYCKVSFLNFLKIFLNFEKRSLMWSMFEIIKSLPQRHLHACCTLNKSTNRKSTRCLCWQCGLFKQKMKNIRNSQSSRQFSLVSEIRRSFLTGAWSLEYVRMYWVEQKGNDWFIENAVEFLQSKVFHWSKRKWLIYRKCNKISTKVKYPIDQKGNHLFYQISLYPYVQWS